MKKLLAQLKQSPTRYAFVCAFMYFVVAASWIKLTTFIVAEWAPSIEVMKRVETLKGLTFVVITSGIFFAFSLSVFRRMTQAAEETVRDQQRLAEAERESAMGFIASSFAHDLNNLLTVLRMGTELLAESSDLPESLRSTVSRLDGSVNRITELTDRMKNAGKSLLREGPEAYDFNATVSETLDFLRLHRALKDCSLELRSERSIIAIGYPILVHQILMNLVLNAAEAMQGSGRILVLVRSVPGSVYLEVHDNGPGIPVQLRESVFEAFFTTKRFGTGLGLVSVKSCVDILGGEVRISDSELGGVAFIARLPVSGFNSAAKGKATEFLNKKRSLADAPNPV